MSKKYNFCNLQIQSGWRLYAAFLLLIFFAGCTLNPLNQGVVSSQSNPTPISVAPMQQAPDARPVVLNYLDAWQKEAYSEMYVMLTSVSQASLSEEEFVAHYKGVAVESALVGVDYEILSLLVNPESAQAHYRVTLKSVLVGDISRDTVIESELGKWAMAGAVGRFVNLT